MSLFFISSANAVSTLETIEVFNKLNHSSSYAESLQCSENESLSENEACAMALCGPPETAVVAKVNDNNFDLYVKPEIKDILPELEKLVEQIHVKKLKELESFIEKFKKALKTKESLLDFNRWDYEYNNFLFSVYEDFLKLKIDNTKPHEVRLQIDIDPPEGLSDIYLKGLDDYAKKKKEQIQNDIYTGIKYNYYTLEESKKHLKELWKDLFELYSEETGKNPDFLSNQRESFLKFQDKSSIDLQDHYLIATTYLKLESLYHQVLKEKQQAFAARSYFPECGDECKKGIEVYLKSLDYQKLIDEVEKKKDQFTLEENIDNCKAQLIAASYKDSDKEKFLSHYSQTKSDFITKAMAQYSEESRLAFEKYLDEEVYLNFNFKSFYSVDEVMKNLRESASFDSYEIKGMPALLNKLVNLRDWKDKTQMQADLDACAEAGSSTLWDGFLKKNSPFISWEFDPSKDNIFVSLFTCTHESQGKGVFSHELGHALSHVLFKGRLSISTKKEYSKIRSCITDSHVEKNETKLPYDLYYNGDHYYSEEDMADYQSFKAVSEETTFTCALLNTNQAGTKYTELHLVNPIKQDTHSASFLRVLREATYKKKPLPSSCKQIIEKNKDKFRFTPCT